MGSEAGIPRGSSERKPAPLPEEVGKHFPQFEILALLGQGGMGAVYKARQPSLDRFVALKILPAQAAADAGFAERFNREARALAKLSHPNIVAVYDFGQADGLHYLIMEYVDGLNLRQLQQAGKLPPREALQIIPQICEALQFAHDEGVVHRDIKPENVLLDKKGRVKIADFGLARILGVEPESYRLTGAKDFMGTPHYMAPEQIEHPQTVDHRADIYSLGVVFYEMLTGELPLGKFQPPSKKVQVDVRLDEVVLHALERDVALRYQNASEVKSDVETITNSGRSGPADSPVGGAGAIHGEREAALKSVQNPAIGLFITGILSWVIIPFTFVILWRLMKDAGPGQAVNMFLSSGLLPMVVGTLMILAGQKMKRLEAYRLAVAACILPMAVLVFKMLGMLLTRSITIGPADLVGAPMGLWALVVLSRPEVKAAFARAALSGSPVVPAARGRFFTTATVILIAFAMIMLMAMTAGVAYLSLARPSPQQIETVTIPSSAPVDDGESPELRAAGEKLSQLRRLYTDSHPLVQAQVRRIEVLEQQSDRMQVPSDFGPINEHSLYSVATQRPIKGLDLDRSEEISLPAEMEKSPEAQFFQWMGERGVDLMAFGHRDSWDLWTSLKLATLDVAWWEQANSSGIRAALEKGTPGLQIAEPDKIAGYTSYQIKTNAALPLTFAFQTATGQFGLLQITDFAETPPGVKIRYKLATPSARSGTSSN